MQSLDCLSANKPVAAGEIDGQFLRFQHLIHIGLWSNSADAPHYCKLAIDRKPI
jgi:hypothetical protein